MSRTQWLIQAKKADFNAIGAAFGISPVTARLIRQIQRMKTKKPIKRMEPSRRNPIPQKMQTATLQMKAMKQAVQLPCLCGTYRK